MRSDDLTREQARAIKEKIAPMLGYLNRLKKRMDRRKFPHDAPRTIHWSAFPIVRMKGRIASLAAKKETFSSPAPHACYPATVAVVIVLTAATNSQQFRKSLD
jgi:hypothetical protein